MHRVSLPVEGSCYQRQFHRICRGILDPWLAQQLPLGHMDQIVETSSFWWENVGNIEYTSSPFLIQWITMFVLNRFGPKYSFVFEMQPAPNMVIAQWKGEHMAVSVVFYISKSIYWIYYILIKAYHQSIPRRHCILKLSTSWWTRPRWPWTQGPTASTGCLARRWAQHISLRGPWWWGGLIMTNDGNWWQGDIPWIAQSWKFKSHVCQQTFTSQPGWLHGNPGTGNCCRLQWTVWYQVTAQSAVWTRSYSMETLETLPFFPQKKSVCTCFPLDT